MFCPKCGAAEQSAQSFCRRCGTYLPDFDELKKREIPPEQHFLANSVLSAMTAIVSLALAILLYGFFLGRDDASPLIYVTAGFLTAIFFWQAQALWRTRQLKKQFPGRAAEAAEKDSPPEIAAAQTNEFLPAADFENLTAAAGGSVIGNTTRKLQAAPLRIND